jgi:hypothetical protein
VAGQAAGTSVNPQQQRNSAQFAKVGGLRQKARNHLSGAVITVSGHPGEHHARTPLPRPRPPFLFCQPTLSLSRLATRCCTSKPAASARAGCLRSLRERRSCVRRTSAGVGGQQRRAASLLPECRRAMDPPWRLRHSGSPGRQAAQKCCNAVEADAYVLLQTFMAGSTQQNCLI